MRVSARSPVNSTQAACHSQPCPVRTKVHGLYWSRALTGHVIQQDSSNTKTNATLPPNALTLPVMSSSWAMSFSFSRSPQVPPPGPASHASCAAAASRLRSRKE